MIALDKTREPQWHSRIIKIVDSDEMDNELTITDFYDNPKAKFRLAFDKDGMLVDAISMKRVHPNSIADLINSIKKRWLHKGFLVKPGEKPMGGAPTWKDTIKNNIRGLFEDEPEEIVFEDEE